MSPLTEERDEYFAADDVVERYAAYDYLEDAERAVLDALRPRLGDARFLDLGVGGGRTTVHFAPLVREYVGVDYSAAMIDACRRRFGDGTYANASFAVADARDLGELEDASFDVVLFSYNGLDCVGDAPDRDRSLEAIHRVLKPGGDFAFSAQNLQRLRLAFSFRRRPTTALKYRLMNPTYRVARTPEGARIADERHGFRRVSSWWVRPDAQVAALARHGFGDVRVFSSRGDELDPSALEAREDPWLYYLCRRLPSDGGTSAAAATTDRPSAPRP